MAKVASMFSLTPLRVHCDSAIQSTFCGAPAHLIGPAGCVKIALPFLIAWISRQTFSTVSAE